MPRGPQHPTTTPTAPAGAPVFIVDAWASRRPARRWPLVAAALLLLMLLTGCTAVPIQRAEQQVAGLGLAIAATACLGLALGPCTAGTAHGRLERVVGGTCLVVIVLAAALAIWA